MATPLLPNALLSLPSLAGSSDTRHRSARDVALFDGISTSLSQRIRDASSSLLVATLATLAAIPHYDPGLYDRAAKLLLSRGAVGLAAAATAGETKPLSEGQRGAEAPMDVQEIMWAASAFSKNKHSTSPSFITALMGRALEVRGFGVCYLSMIPNLKGLSMRSVTLTRRPLTRCIVRSTNPSPPISWWSSSSRWSTPVAIMTA